MLTRRSRWGQRGGTQVLFLICCPVLLAGVALCVDIGSIYITRQALQNGCDAAAKAGGMELPIQNAAIAECKECARENNLDTADDRLFITLMNNGGKVVPGSDNKSARRLEVKAVKDVPMTFARIFGIDEWPVAARAVVAMDDEPVNVVTRNTTPFGVAYDLYDAENDVSIAAVPCTPKKEANLPEVQQLWILPSNLLPADVERLLVEGNPTTLGVGDHVPVEPNTEYYMEAIRRAMLELARSADQLPDPDSISPNNPRILTIPLVRRMDGSAHGKDTRNVEIVGFASFYVTKMMQRTIEGRFVDTPSTDGQVDDTRQPSQGNQNGKIRAVRLIE